MGDAQGPSLDASFDSKEDYEMYVKLMGERKKIQVQLEEKKRKKKVIKRSVSMEQREKGFEVNYSGANVARIDEARRRELLQKQASQESRGYGGGKLPPASKELSAASKEWQMGTVELKGKDGQVFRTSPHLGGGPQAMGKDSYSDDNFEVATDDEAICEELPDSRGVSPSVRVVDDDEGSSSRPVSAGSRVDQETRSVLRVMETANRDELLLLRESLTKQVADRRVAASSPMSRMRVSSTRLLHDPERSRPSSAVNDSGNLSRPSSSSSAIAEAIKAENARVKALASGNALDGIGAEGAEQVQLLTDASSGSRPPSRPASKSGNRLPLSPEAALESAPPSVVSGAPGRRPPSGQAGYGGSSGAEAPRNPGGYASNAMPPANDQAVSSKSAAPSFNRPPLDPSGGYASAASSAPAAAGEGDIVDRVSRLDQRKQKALLRVLDSLEEEKMNSPPKSEPVAASIVAPLEAPLSARRDMPQVPPTLGASALRLRVLSNWGAARQCGLSLIEAFDRTGEVLRIPPAALSLHGTQSGSTTISRVLEGAPHTTSEKSMWVGTVCPSQASLDCPATAFEPFELVLNLPESMLPPAALRLWNFNSSDGLAKGMKDAEVWRDGVRIWAGQVPLGSGTSDNAEAIALLDPGFVGVAYSSAPAAGGAVAARPISSGASKDRPIWLEGAAPSSNTESLPWDAAQFTLGGPSGQAGIPAASVDLESDSPKPADRRRGSGPNDRDRELEMSLAALEEFRTSQSRRFFGLRASRSQEDLAKAADLKVRPSALAQSAEDWRAPVGEACAAAGGSATVSAEDSASYTANFGGRPPRPAKVDQSIPETAQSFAIDGIGEIPILDFAGGENDVLDGLIDDRCIMGSSIVPDSMAQSVIIPITPCGRMLVFNCVSTWGDQNFLGLAGIEMFDSRGFPVVLKDVLRQVTANPPSINVLSEYGHDPRTVDKLFDQVNLTRDDLHVWLAPFFPGQAHTVTIDLERHTHLSMIRVWNYNKSRLHSSRGVRDLEILLDGVPIFVGEVARAPGLLTCPEQACEHILFTQDEAVLQVIEEHDWLPAHLPLEDDDEDEGEYSLQTDELDIALRELANDRPMTADTESRQPRGGTAEASPHGSGSDGRPITRASMARVTARGMVCGTVTLVLHSTWGDAFYCGLTAIELLDSRLEPIPLEPQQIDASPRDLNDLEEVEDDPRTIDNLLDGVSCTTDDHHMWLAPFTKVSTHVENRAALNGTEGSLDRNLIRFDFDGERQEVAGFNMWNYNKNVEDTSRGVKEFSVYCDDKYIATFLCRKAPGHVHFDFKQVILLDQPPCMDASSRRAMMQGVPSVAPRMPSRGRNEPGRHRSSSRDGGPRASSRERPRSGGPADLPTGSSNSSSVQQQYETPLHPCGFVFRLVLLSSWSDVHYIGLDGIELYNLEGRPVRPLYIHSNHGSVRSLPGMEGDIRTEDNLLEGAPGTSGRMWLAPYIRAQPNSVELVFDEPTHISCVHLWNYTRTPSRGARDIEIYVDDLLVYQGILRQEESSLAPGRARGEAVLFTSLPDIVARERGFVYLPSAEELVTFFDDEGKMGQKSEPTDFLERPMTALVQQR